MILDRLKWAVGTFGPYKTLEGDEISPVMPKKGLKALSLPLCTLLRASLIMGSIFSCWQATRVVFIFRQGTTWLGEEFKAHKPNLLHSKATREAS